MAWSPSEEWSARSQIWKFPLPENAKKEFGLGDIAWWAQGGACSAVQGGMQLHGRVRKWGRTWTGSSKSRERLLAGPGRVTLKERWGRRGVHRRWWWKAFIEDGKTGRDLRSIRSGAAWAEGRDGNHRWGQIRISETDGP